MRFAASTSQPHERISLCVKAMWIKLMTSGQHAHRHTMHYMNIEYDVMFIHIIETKLS